MVEKRENLVLERWEARDILWGDHPDPNTGLVEDKISGHSRWTVDHEIVIEYKGQYYIGGYSVGATEQQDEQAWEYDDFVTFIPAKKTIIEMEVWEAE